MSNTAMPPADVLPTDLLPTGMLSAGAVPGVPCPSGSRSSMWAQLRASAATWSLPARRTVVVAPHPDDEVLGAGGIISRQLASGIEVIVLAVTDGDASYPSVDPKQVAALRRREQQLALGELAPMAPQLRRLGLPDGRVVEHERELTKILGNTLRRDDLVVAPWVRDHHCDHEAVGRAAVSVASTNGCMLVASLFWAWQRTDPDRTAATSIRRVDLGAEELRRRSSAMQRHRSQITDLIADPILVPSDLAPLQWTSEFYLVEP